MVFSSAIFLFAFFPIFILTYAIVPIRRNLIYLLFSLAFFFIGEGWFVAVMLISITLNYSVAYLLSVFSKYRRTILAFGVIGNLAILFYFKYLGFLLNDVLYLNIDAANNIHLVLGISFFTFQGLSYLIDVFRGDCKVQKDPFKLALYISMFPQLIAGPIVRYAQVEKEINERHVDLTDVYHGLAFFCIGLASKVLIADPVALVADQVFNNVDQAGGLDALFGISAYTLQIFFDFAGYSGMAIGLGRLTGFFFPKNFDYPYMSRSITEFWRRWHISLSSWFRDYVYIPLGGNRGRPFQTYFNLLVVFTVTGFWHGAAWNFIFWGWWHGLALLIERAFLKRILDKLPAFVGVLYVLVWVMIGWVLFRVNEIGDFGTFFQTFFGSSASAMRWDYLILEVDFLLPFIAGLVFATHWPRNVIGQFIQMPSYTRLASERLGVRHVLGALLLSLLFALSVIKILTGGYSPFIYFRF